MGSLRGPRGPVGSKESSPPMRRRRLSRRLLAQSSLQVLSISQVLHRVAFVKYERRKERSCEGEEAMMAGFNPRTKWARARTRRSRGAHCATRHPGGILQTSHSSSANPSATIHGAKPSANSTRRSRKIALIPKPVNRYSTIDTFAHIFTATRQARRGTSPTAWSVVVSGQQESIQAGNMSNVPLQ